MTVREKFFEDLATALDSWVNTAVESVTDPEKSLRWADKPESFLVLQEAFAQSGVSKDAVRQVFFECLQGQRRSKIELLPRMSSKRQ